MLGLAHRGFALDDYNQHLVSYLNERGFHTVLCGVQHEGAGCFDYNKGGEILGYRDNITTPIDTENINGKTTAQWDISNAESAAKWLSHKGHDPFFLSMGLFSTHREYPELPSVNPDLVRPVPPIYNNSENRKDHACFLESQKVYDRAFKTVIEALEGGPYKDDTIVVVTTDHGLALPFTKCNLNEAGMGVALMIKVPGHRPSVPYSDALISQVDVFPTLCDLLKTGKPEGLQGKSFVHLFDHPEKSHRTHIFGEINFHTSFEPERSVRTERFSYIKNCDRDDRQIRLSNIDNSPAKNLLLKAGFSHREKAEAELYDLYFDPMEKNNLVDDPLYRVIQEELESILEKWQIETDDPLLKGELPLREGLVINRVSCIEPDSDKPGDYL